MLFYPAALPLSRQTLDYTAGIIRRHRRDIGSCWRKVNPGPQAQILADLAEAPLLPVPRRAAGQGRPRPSDSRDRTMTWLAIPVREGRVVLTCGFPAFEDADLRTDDGPPGHEHRVWSLDGVICAAQS
jgi:hypothetical protein